MRKLNFKKVLFGLSVSLVLAMAIGSFAIGDNQTPANPQVETRGAVNAPDSGDFTVTATDGETVLTDNDYSYSGGVLTIKSTTPMTIKNTNSSSTTDRIKVDLTSDSEANITLDGVNISTTNQGAAFEIKDDATFNVNIKIADDSENTLTATADNYAGLQKNGDSGVGTLTITGSTGENAGELTATGGNYGAGIGGGYNGSGTNITITGGVVKATGGDCAAGIGGGYQGNGSTITISGGVVTATGGDYGAGIGGGYQGNGSTITISGGVVTATGGDNGAGIGGGAYKNGSNITISGGVVTATGGDYGAGIGGGIYESGSDITISGGTVIATGGDTGAGIGGGAYKNGSNNSITGDNVVVIAESVDAYKVALDGFSSIDKGLIFRNGQETSGVWSGTMHSNAVKVTADVKFPADLEVGAGKVLTVGSKATLTIAEGTELTNNGTVTVENGATLVNEGTITDNGTLTCNGTITTRTHFYLADGTAYGTDNYYQTYRTSAGVQKYKDLPNPDDPTLLKNSLNSDEFIYWYYLNGSTEVKIDNSKDVEPNQHKFYEKRATAYAVTIPTFENGSVTSDVTEAYSGDTVTLTVTPAEGYELQENSLKVMAGTTSVTVTKGADGKYTFTMPASNVNVSAVFEEKTYEISIDQPEHGTVELDKDTAKAGDEVGFTLTPDDGYELKEVKVTDKDGNEIQVTEKDGKYTFTMPDSEVKIIAVFEGTSHEVTIDQPENGTVTVNPEKPKTGDEVTITLKPEEGYKPGGAPVVRDEDGNEIELTPTGNPGEYKFIMPNSNLTIDVNFVPDSTPTPPGPEPGPTPEPIPDPSVDPDGDGSGASSKTSDPFMGGIALALLGVATTGAVLVRKRK